MKDSIRTDILSKNIISKKEKSEAIHKSLLDTEEYKDAKTVMFYVSTKNEVETHLMIKEALRHKSVLVPKVSGEEIVPIEIKDFSELIPGAHDILEPMGGNVFQGKIDLVIVPGVAFDQDKHRLGYGHGYYDKFLAQTDAITIGLAFEENMVEKLPREPHDINVDKVITDKKII